MWIPSPFSAAGKGKKCDTQFFSAGLGKSRPLNCKLPESYSFPSQFKLPWNKSRERASAQSLLGYLTFWCGAHVPMSSSTPAACLLRGRGDWDKRQHGVSEGVGAGSGADSWAGPRPANTTWHTHTGCFHPSFLEMKFLPPQKQIWDILKKSLLLSGGLVFLRKWLEVVQAFITEQKCFREDRSLNNMLRLEGMC